MKALLVVVMLLGLFFSYESSFAQARYDDDYYWGDESIPASKGISGELIILIIIIGAVFFIRLHFQDRAKLKAKRIEEQKIKFAEWKEAAADGKPWACINLGKVGWL
tara:strand:- start:199 stop:519 length:321 start_codon:yes stop_codon:yes gene_type:complete